MTWGDAGATRPSGNRAGRVRDALQAITSDVSKNRRSIGARPAWGQFLDVPASNRQVGIYGTSSAIRILMNASVGGTSAEDAMPTLPGTDRSAATGAFEDDDLALTLKCCSIIEARASLGPPSTVMHVENVLLTSALGNVDLSQDLPTSLAGQYAGWGFATKYADVDFTEVRPDVLATAHVILALRTARVASRVPATEREAVNRQIAYAMRWIAAEVNSKSDSSPTEWALTLLAAKTFLGEPEMLGMPAEKLVRQLRTTLKRRLRGGRIAALPRAEPRFYSVPRTGGRTENHYVTFPVHYIVSWALAADVSGRLPRQRQIFDVCDRLSQAVYSHGAPVSIATGRKSITDSLYAVNLLRAVSARVNAIDSNAVRRWGPHLASVAATGLACLVLLGGAVVAGVISVSGDPTEVRGIATFAVGILPIPAVALGRQAWELGRRGP